MSEREKELKALIKRKKKILSGVVCERERELENRECEWGKRDPHEERRKGGREEGSVKEREQYPSCSWAAIPGQVCLASKSHQ